LRLRNLVVTLAFAAPLATVHAGAQQSLPAASRLLELSTFGGLTGTYTGLSGGRNLGITAGVDIGLPTFYGFRPYVEGRGTYPIDRGQIDAQKSALGGVRVERHILRIPRLTVYGDILLGRGQIDYQNGGYPSLSGNFLYISSTGPVYSPGLGGEYRFTDHFSAFADAQFQHWTTPATPSGSLWSKPITLSVRYRFNFNRHGYPVAP
jgi:hypothetical protein